MCHELYAAASSAQGHAVLKENIEFDPAYTNINLKGTKPANIKSDTRQCELTCIRLMAHVTRVFMAIKQYLEKSDKLQ